MIGIRSWCSSKMLLCCYTLAMGVVVVVRVPVVTALEEFEPIRPPADSILLGRQQQQQQQQQHVVVDEVGHTAEAAAIRKYQLRKKKRKGFLQKKEKSLAEVLFPGVAPELYKPKELVFMMTDLVQSKKTHVPFEYYDLPVCEVPPLAGFRRRHPTQRKNLGARLQGVELKPAPFSLTVLQNMTCTKLCTVDFGIRKIRWLRKLVERQYRVHFTFDSLPILMRSTQLNYAVRGYPVGFKAPPTYTGLQHDEYFLYNHLRFTITYQQLQQQQQEGIYITGFDVHPVTLAHDDTTCNGTPESSPKNSPDTYLPIRSGPTGEELKVTYSYEVEWIESKLPWEDRWDVYLIGSPDDDIHFFAIVNSLMVVLFLTGAIATIMIRTLRNDISAYNEMALLEDGHDETGWKLVHGDVFRPPSVSPMALAVLVGNGAQIGVAFLISMLAAVLKLLNPVKKGHTLTALVVLYVLSGCVAGYVSARIYKFCADAKHWKTNTVLTATALPGVLVGIFTILNIFLSFAGAATAVGFFTLLAIFALWAGVSTPLVFVGAYFGLQAPKLEVPTKTNQIARFVPELPWYATPPVSCLLGGILPFGSVCIELFFIMSALWLHQIYYVMGFLLAVLLILAATCAQVSIAMTYLQLCSEDHRWWWKSFFNCASAGVYLILYSLWFLVSRLELVGVLPVVIYLTYMSMISLLFSIFCGSVGFLCSLAFIRTIYGAVKVD